MSVHDHIGPQVEGSMDEAEVVEVTNPPRNSGSDVAVAVQDGGDVAELAAELGAATSGDVLEAVSFWKRCRSGSGVVRKAVSFGKR